jgi:tetratricopeptide (TPR) repeat protein
MIVRIIAISLLFYLLTGCSMPRIILINDPLDARQHNDLGLSYQQRGEYDIAVRELERAADLDRKWALPLYNLGNLRAARGEWELAAGNFRAALQRDPSSAEAMNNLAWVLLKTGDDKEALRWSEQAVKTDPSQPAFLDTLAEVQIAVRDYPAARLTVERALSVGSGPALMKSLGEKKILLDNIP